LIWHWIFGSPSPGRRSQRGILIEDGFMTLEVGRTAVATVRFSQHAAADGNGAWSVPTCLARLFAREQAITALSVADLLESGYPNEHPLVVALRRSGCRQTSGLTIPSSAGFCCAEAARTRHSRRNRAARTAGFGPSGRRPSWPAGLSAGCGRRIRSARRIGGSGVAVTSTPEASGTETLPRGEPL
jgi:hypothetical protein